MMTGGTANRIGLPKSSLVVGAFMLVLAMIATLFWAPAATAAPRQLPKGLTFWQVVDYSGVDCAECDGYRVLHRLSSRRARLAYLTRYVDGTRAVSCTSLHRTGGGRWLDSNHELWSYQPARTTSAGDRVGARLRAADLKGTWWVDSGHASRAAVIDFLNSASLRRDYEKCVG